MFYGSHDHVLDEKGRTSLPKGFRKTLEAYDGDPWLTALPWCLTIYPPDQFEALRRKLTEASSTIESVHGLQRMLLGQAVPAAVDRQGRILIPNRLREWASLKRDIVFTGVGDRIEVWDRARLAAALEQSRMNYSNYTEIQKDLGL